MSAKKAKVKGKKERQGLLTTDRIIVMLALLLFFPPFFRGLFFEKEFRFFTIAVSILFISYIFREIVNDVRDNSPALRRPDMFVLAFAGIYLLGIITGLHKEMAFNSFLRMWTFFLVYRMVSRSPENESHRMWLVSAVYISGVLLALTPVSSALGLIVFNSAYEGGRFFSTLQYPNSFAVYMIVVSIMGYYLYSTSAERMLKGVITVANTFVFLSFLGSLSRGAWLVYPLVMAVSLLLTPKKTDFLYHYIIVWLGGLAGYTTVFSAGEGKTLALRLALLAVLAAAAFLVNYSSESILCRLQNIRYKNVIIALLLLAIIAAGAFTISGMIGAEDIRSSLNRMIDIDFSTINAMARLYFYKDAASMALDRPLFGFGGGGWQSGYLVYQKHAYFTTEVHSHWLQVLIETGFIGLLVHALFWLYILKKLYKLYRTQDDSDMRSRVNMAAMSLLALGMHSAIDFDFSIGSVYLLFWFLAGYTENIGHNFLGIAQAAEKRQVWIKPGLALAAIFAMLISVSFSIAENNYNAAIEATNNGEYIKAEQFFKKAEAANPLSANTLRSFSEFYFQYGLETNNNDLLLVAIKMMNNAAAYDKYNSGIRMNLSQMYFGVGMLPEAIREMENTQKYQKMYINNYKNLMNCYFTAGIETLKAGDKSLAVDYFRAVLEADKRMKNVWDSVSEERKQIWQYEKLLRTPEMALYLAKANLMLNETEDVEVYFNEVAGDENIKGELLLWKALYYNKTGDELQLNTALQELKDYDEALMEDYTYYEEILSLG